MAEKISQKGKKRVLNEIILVNSWQKKRPKKNHTKDVVRDFRRWEVMTKVRYFLYLIFNFRVLETPIGSKFSKIKVFRKSRTT